MKMKNLYGLLLFSLFATSLFSSCKDEKVYDLKLEATSGEVSVDRLKGFQILGGNGDYVITVADENILNAFQNLPPDADSPFGSISVLGKQKGETTLTITDKISQQSVSIRIKVIDNYLCFRVNESTHPALSPGRRMFLIANDRRDVYFFEDNEDNTLYHISQGSYVFSIENKIPYLTLYYTDSGGRFSDILSAPTPHKFSLSDTNESLLKGITMLLGLDWEELKAMDTRNSPTVPQFFKMKEVGTGIGIVTYVDYSTIPVGILQQ